MYGILIQGERRRVQIKNVRVRIKMLILFMATVVIMVLSAVLSGWMIDTYEGENVVLFLLCEDDLYLCSRCTVL